MFSAPGRACRQCGPPDRKRKFSFFIFRIRHNSGSFAPAGRKRSERLRAGGKNPRPAGVGASAKSGFSAAGESDPRRRAHAVRPPTGHMRHPVPTRRTLRRGMESRGRDPASGRMRTYRPPPNSTAPTAPADRRCRPRAPAPAVSVRSERAAASPRRMRRTGRRPRAAPTARRQAHNRRSSEVSFFQPKLRQR